MTKITCENGHHIYNWIGKIRIGDVISTSKIEPIGSQPLGKNGSRPELCHICKGDWLRGSRVGFQVHTEKGWFPPCPSA